MAIQVPAVGEETQRLDALPRLDYRSRHRALASEHPPPGQYLALEDARETRLLALEREVTHIGRGFTCDVVLDDQSVSRRHAIIMRREGVTEILDESSSNGTYVNGRLIESSPLHDGDVIMLGQVVIGYHEVSEPIEL